MAKYLAAACLVACLLPSASGLDVSKQQSKQSTASLLRGAFGLLEVLDVGRSLSLSKSTFARKLTNLFEKVDTDSSGTISSPELGTFLGHVFEEFGAAFERRAGVGTGTVLLEATPATTKLEAAEEAVSMPEATPTRRLGLMDVSQSIALSRTGFAPVLANVFEKVDTDSSGTISTPELGMFLGRVFKDVGVAMEHVGRVGAGATPTGDVGLLDVGHGLAFTKTQMQPALENIFGKVDTDSSGTIEMTELATYLMSVLDETGAAVKRMGGVVPVPDM